MRIVLAVICWLTLAASAFLSLSYLTLKGVGDLRPVWGLLWFVLPSALTLVVMATGFGLDSRRNPSPWPWLMIAVGAALVWVGWSTIDRMLSSPHFEGYALVMGAMAMLQGSLTAILFTMAGLQKDRIAGLN